MSRQMLYRSDAISLDWPLMLVATRSEGKRVSEIKNSAREPQQNFRIAVYIYAWLLMQGRGLSNLTVGFRVPYNRAIRRARGACSMKSQSHGYDLQSRRDSPILVGDESIA